MTEGDIVKARWSDGLEAIGTYRGVVRGYVILETEDGKSIVCNRSHCEFEVITEGAAQ